MLEKVAVYPLQKKRLPKVSNFFENFPKSQFSSPFSHRQTTMMGTMRNSKIAWQEKRAWSLASGSLRSDCHFRSLISAMTEKSNAWMVMHHSNEMSISLAKDWQAVFVRWSFQEVNRQVAVACCGPLRIPQENVGRKLRTLRAVRWLEDSVQDVYNCWIRAKNLYDPSNLA